MKNSRIEDRDFEVVAEELGVSPADVKNVVNSFFDSIVYEARKLPFDDCRKIYSKTAFEKHSSVRSIPFIGRLGPTYTRYLKWRANESKNVNMVPRPKSKTKLFPEEIEAIAQSVLAGNVYEPLKTRTKNYKRVWLVFDSHKKQAGQVIPKEEDVYYQEG